MAASPSPQDELERLAGWSGAPVETRLDETLRPYWLERVARHTHDSYAGIPLAKFPEDLRVYEHLLWALRPDTVIELGAHVGASALWFRDRLRTLLGYGLIAEVSVVTVELEADRARPFLDRADASWGEQITLMEGDVRDEELPGRVAGALRPGARCLVVEDSAHIYETTMAALRGFARFVPAGGFFVVEDGCVDVEAMRLEESWPRGVLPAVADWLELEEGRAFRARRDLELYGITCHPGGFLQRAAG